MKFFLNENLCSKMQLDSLEKNELIFCLLGLNGLEGKVFLFLFKNPSSKVTEIAESVHRHRSSIQKTVSQLIDKGLITRKSVNLRRGYQYVYHPIPKKEIKKSLMRDVERWSQLIKERITKW
ncbi:MAG: helix-turn-helix domain-containing protein [Euryarchaeota archaeon]|nr:helix-turn-helix domain-containing protein [Euryarchaeota archaeon]